MEKELIILSKHQETPSVTILLSTHRTHPDNKQDGIQLKNLVNTAEKRLHEQYDKRTISPILEKLKAAEATIDHDYNLDTLAIFASPSYSNITRLPVTTTDRVVIGDRFEIRPLA